MSRLHILVIEDNDMQRNAIISLLKAVLPEIFDVVEAKNGKEAVEEFKLADPRFDLVISDGKMPEPPLAAGSEKNWQGWDVVNKIRKFEQKHNMKPVVIFSWSTEEEFKNKAFPGADDFLPKPVRKVELIQILKEWNFIQEKKLKASDQLFTQPRDNEASTPVKEKLNIQDESSPLPSKKPTQ